MTISEGEARTFLENLDDIDLWERRRAAEQRKARAEIVLRQVSVDERKRDTRRKIVLGGAVIAAARCDSDFRDHLRSVLDATVRGRDRALLGLDPLPSDAANADTPPLCDNRR